MKQPPRDYVPASGQKCALGPLPEDYPTPSFTFTLCHFSVVAALCSTQTPQGKDPPPFLYSLGAIGDAFHLHVGPRAEA